MARRRRESLDHHGDVSYAGVSYAPREGLRTMTNVNQAPLPKAPLVRASLVKRRYIKYLALPLPFFIKIVRMSSHLL